ncbi:hypothetical protein ACRRTK_013801 [Alexandromys fortis]
MGLDKRIILHDTSSKKLVRTFVVDTPLTSVDFMHDGATWAIGSSRGKIYQYDARFNNGCSNKRTSANKRSVAVSNSSRRAVREATAPSIATVLPQPVTTAMAKGVIAAQDKAGLSSRSINRDILRKQTCSSVLVGSPGKEESESHDLEAEAERTYPGKKQEPKDSLKQFAKLISSGTEPGIRNTSPSSTRNLEKYKKPKKETEALSRWILNSSSKGSVLCRGWSSQLTLRRNSGYTWDQSA